MADPVRMILDDGTELVMFRCPNCQCPRSVDYRCSGCEAKAWKAAYIKLRDGVSEAKLEAHRIAP